MMSRSIYTDAFILLSLLSCKGPFYWRGLTVIRAWINDYIYNYMSYVIHIRVEFQNGFN